LLDKTVPLTNKQLFLLSPSLFQVLARDLMLTACSLPPKEEGMMPSTKLSEGSPNNPRAKSVLSSIRSCVHPFDPSLKGQLFVEITKGSVCLCKVHHFRPKTVEETTHP